MRLELRREKEAKAPGRRAELGEVLALDGRSILGTGGRALYV